MPNNEYVQRLTLQVEREQKVAFADVMIGPVVVTGVTVWRCTNGRLRVFFPSQKMLRLDRHRGSAR